MPSNSYSSILVSIIIFQKLEKEIKLLPVEKVVVLQDQGKEFIGIGTDKNKKSIRKMVGYRSEILVFCFWYP